MTGPSRRLARELAARWLGERPMPVGGVARDRRLLKAVLRQQVPGRVLVVGHGLAARQALRGQAVDVAGTDPHHAHVTVCSAVADPLSLPVGRWDTVIVTEPGADPAARLRAAEAACRAGGRLLVLDADRRRVRVEEVQR